jgi:hypothetical protein
MNQRSSQKTIGIMKPGFSKEPQDKPLLGPCQLLFLKVNPDWTVPITMETSAKPQATK